MDKPTYTLTLNANFTGDVFCARSASEKIGKLVYLSALSGFDMLNSTYHIYMITSGKMGT